VPLCLLVSQLEMQVEIQVETKATFNPIFSNEICILPVTAPAGPTTTVVLPSAEEQIEEAAEPDLVVGDAALAWLDTSKRSLTLL